MLQRAIDWIFRLEEINGHGICPTYLWRWTLFACPWFKVYLHHFVGDDWSRDLHDHPKQFISLGLRGSYVEETPDGFRIFRAPWLRSFPAEHRHRLSARDCWTLVVVGRWRRDWGFWHRGEWIRWDRYVRSDRAAARKACP